MRGSSLCGVCHHCMGFVIFVWGLSSLYGVCHLCGGVFKSGLGFKLKGDHACWVFELVSNFLSNSWDNEGFSNDY